VNEVATEISGIEDLYDGKAILDLLKYFSFVF
jgi:hypothetical protein